MGLAYSQASQDKDLNSKQSRYNFFKTKMMGVPTVCAFTKIVFRDASFRGEYYW